MQGSNAHRIKANRHQRLESWSLKLLLHELIVGLEDIISKLLKFVLQLGEFADSSP